MLEDKIREVFADMVVLKDPQRSEYFSNLSTCKEVINFKIAL